MQRDNAPRSLTLIDAGAVILLILFGGLMLGQHSIPSHAAKTPMAASSSFADDLKDMLLHD